MPMGISARRLRKSIQKTTMAPPDMSGATVSRETEPELRMNQRVPHQRVIQLF